MPKSQSGSESSRVEPYQREALSDISSTDFLEVPSNPTAAGKKARRAEGRRSKLVSQRSAIASKLGLSSSSISVFFRRRDVAHEMAVLGKCLGPEDPLFLDYKHISTPGTVYVVDKISLEPHLVARITPFSEMGVKDREDFETIFSHLAEDSSFKYNITKNGAMVDGTMFGLGWRAGYDAGVSMGTYAVVTKTEDRKKQWEVLKKQEKLIHDIYGQRFCSLAPTLFNNAANYLEENSLPYIGYKYNASLPQDSENYLFASNLTYTIKNFHNAAHHDNDASDVTYGIWAPCNKFGRLSSKEDGFTKSDGFFYVAPYKIIVDFAAVDGVVELIWKGATDAHSTVRGTVSEGFETWGSSCQTSRHLMHRITKALKSVSDAANIKFKEN